MLRGAFGELTPGRRPSFAASDDDLGLAGGYASFFPPPETPIPRPSSSHMMENPYQTV